MTLEHGANSFPGCGSAGQQELHRHDPGCRGDNAEFVIAYVINGQPEPVVVGSVQFYLYDPSGVVTDATTDQPVQHAQVVLFRIPGWRPI